MADLRELSALNEALRRQVQWLERERSLLAFEIHDGLVQEITAASMFLDTAERVWESRPDEARRLFAEARRLIKESVVETRLLMEGLRPAALEQGGLGAALAELAARARRVAGRDLQIDVECRLTIERFAAAIESAIYRVTQEALSNAVKHSGASRAWVTLQQEGDELALAIRDDGAGFDLAAANSRRFGLRGMRERVEMFGQVFRIDSQPGQGTRVEARFPATPPIIEP